MSDIPRRRISELVTRWILEKIPQVVVEGPSDMRFLRLVQEEEHCLTSIRSVDVLSVDLIEVPASILEQHGLNTSGARQRVIACIREVGCQAVEDGFRGIIDADLDIFKGIDLSSSSLWYTDYGCMDGYSWNLKTLKRLVVQMRCEKVVSSAVLLKSFFKSVNRCCFLLAVLRFASFKHPDWSLKIHHSDKSLSIIGCEVRLDINKYISQCGLSKASLLEAKQVIPKCVEEFKDFDPLLALNGHDLLWILEFCFRALTSGVKAQVGEAQIYSAMVAHGIAEEPLMLEPVFKLLAEWAMQATQPEVV